MYIFRRSRHRITCLFNQWSIHVRAGFQSSCILDQEIGHVFDPFNSHVCWWFTWFLWLSINIGNFIIPTAEVIFFRGVGSTTNQIVILYQFTLVKVYKKPKNYRKSSFFMGKSAISMAMLGFCGPWKAPWPHSPPWQAQARTWWCAPTWPPGAWISAMPLGPSAVAAMENGPFINSLMIYLLKI